MNQDTIVFILGILGETREEFRQAFIEMSHSTVQKDRRKFVALYANLLEVVFGNKEYRIEQPEKGGTI